MSRQAGQTARELVGREEIVDDVLARLARRRSALLVGDPGIGKTTILDRVSSQLPGACRAVAVGALRRHPYLALRSAFAELPTSGSTETVTRFVAEALGDRVLVFDDVQWCDHDTLDVLRGLVFQAPLLLASRRGELATGLAEELGEAMDAIEVSPLDDREVRQLARRLRPGALDPDIVRWSEAARGNPLLLEVAVDSRTGRPDDPVPTVTLLIDELGLDEQRALARLTLGGQPARFEDAVTAPLARTAPRRSTRRRRRRAPARAVRRRRRRRAPDDERRAIHRSLAEETTTTRRSPRSSSPPLVIAPRLSVALERRPFGRLLVVPGRAARACRGAGARARRRARGERSGGARGAGRYNDALARLDGFAGDDPRVAARAAVVRARAHWSQTELDEARAAIEEGLLLLDGSGSEGEIELLSLRTRILARVDWDLDGAIALGATTVELAERVGTGIAGAHSSLGLAHLMAGNRAWEEHLERAGLAARDDLHEAVVIYDTLFFAHLLSGDPTRCRRSPMTWCG